MAANRNSQRKIFSGKSWDLEASGKESPAKMTPQREKRTPKDVDPGHTV